MVEEIETSVLDGDVESNVSEIRDLEEEVEGGDVDVERRERLVDLRHVFREGEIVLLPSACVTEGNQAC